MDYLKHDGFDSFLGVNLPEPILKIYEGTCNYQYIDIKGYGEIPITKFSLLDLKNTDFHSVEFESIPLEHYAKGFISGFNSDIRPFVDTPDYRKEKLIYEIVKKGFKSIPLTYNGEKHLYMENDLYVFGIFEGKRYKAWSYIIEQPNLFIDFFTITDAKKKIAELKSKHNLKEPEIVLLLYYNKEVVKPGIYTTSIYTKYKNAEKDDNRILVNERKTKLKNQIERIKKIMPLLNDPKEAKTDLEKMEKDFNRRFY